MNTFVPAVTTNSSPLEPIYHVIRDICINWLCNPVIMDKGYTNVPFFLLRNVPKSKEVTIRSRHCSDELD